jgi:hypothetical protein
VAGHPEAQCVIIDRKTSGSKDDFLAALEKGCKADSTNPANDSAAQIQTASHQNCKVHLQDKDGNEITKLPDNLAAMGDDKYRSLAWYVRNAHGFCRSDMDSKDFAEFIWADWLRPRLKLEADWTRDDAKAATEAAMALVTGDTAKDVQGWVGKNPSHKCADW